jgi:hypothetical protein
MGGSGGAGTGGIVTTCDGFDCTLPNGHQGICVNDFCGPCLSDQACIDGYGAGNLCINGECLPDACRTQADCGGGRVCDLATNKCFACTDDASCVARYGAGHLCIAQKCVTGDCRTNSDCTGGHICDASSNTCGVCGDDAACMGAYGAGFICVAGGCVTGECHAASDCATGEICAADHTCQPCSGDASCLPGYGANHLCIAGACVSGNCRSPADCAAGRLCDANTRFCVDCASDAACQSALGAGHLCLNNACITGECRTAANCSNGQLCVSNACTDCTNDTTCEAQYGADHLCISGGCIPGECRTAADCAPGQLCDATFACTACTTDMQCVSGYGPNHLCVNNACIAGDCRATADCGGGRICNTAAFTCVACASDASCVANYGADHLCVGGNCISGNCRNASDCTGGAVCDANTFMCTPCTTDMACVLGYGPQHLCVNNACIPGQCRTSPECPAGGLCDVGTHTCGACSTDAECVTGYGTNHLCVNNACVSGTCHTTADCGGGTICSATNFTCEPCASDAACVGAYGPNHLCEGNVCIVGSCRTSANCGGGKLCDTQAHTCNACASDAACQVDAAYGTSTFCLSGACTTGDCRDTNDCATGQLCGSTQANSCGPCSGDGQCTGDASYGAGNICYQGICQLGDCHGTSADCTGATAGLICGASTENRCGACSSDQQCQQDPIYGSSKICHTTAAQPNTGKCVSSACSNSGACAANAGDFCCSSLCVPGNCCADADCVANPSFGPGYACVNNHCTGCDGVTGKDFLVDPVNGNDAKATGSGTNGGVVNASCRFKTLTKALLVAGNFAAPGTRIIIVGQAGVTTSLAGNETLPILVPANVTIATQDGPILLTLPATADTVSYANVAGFQLAGDKSGIVADRLAPLTIDGATNTSGIAVAVAPGTGKTATVSHVSVQYTGGHGITVTSGASITIGPGVTVKNAGAATHSRNGLNITSGTVHVRGGTGQDVTTFADNSQHGIYVAGTGVIDILGVPASGTPNGQGTVVTSGNVQAGVRIFAAPGGAQNVIDGLVAWKNHGSGLRLNGGLKVKVRNSVFLGSDTNGIYLNGSDSTATGNDLTQIDLGAAGSPGNNFLQASSGQNPNLTGLCVSMSANQGPLTLHAAGNHFAGDIDCATSTAPLFRLIPPDTCSANVDVATNRPQNPTMTDTVVTVDVAGCM